MEHTMQKKRPYIFSKDTPVSYPSGGILHAGEKADRASPMAKTIKILKSKK